MEHRLKKKDVSYSGKVCSACGAPLEEDAMFCTNCGTKVSEEVRVEEEESVKKVCKNCGAELEDGNRFCMNCGTPIED